MSIEATSWALNVPIGGNAKVVLLGLANHAHPDGSETYPALDTLARYAACDRSTARRNVRRLIAEGWIAEDGKGPKGQSKFRLALHRDPLAGGGKTPPHGATQGVALAPAGGGTGARKGVAPMPPEPSIEPSKNHPLAESARDSAEQTLDIGSLLERLAGPIKAGILVDPRADGGDMLLADQATQHGIEIVRDALDEIVAFASRTGTSRTMTHRNLSFHLPGAIRRVKASRRDPAGTPEDRPSWTETTEAIDGAARRHHDDALAALRELSQAAPLAALLAVTVGWRAWCDRPTGDAFGAGDVERKHRATYNRLRPDPETVARELDRLELNAARRAAVDRGENPYDPEHPLAQAA